ncbi:MAG: FAD binding domain-containing protein, partial [Candidatus Rokubacteria bacterium]|nr:FAD binding domain-containing protein [Candidatus Rokubacteria bacterium]
MYPAAFQYHAPTSVKDALKLLGKLKDDAKLLAGGHSLIPMMKLRLAQPKHLIDLRKVPGLGGIKEDGGTIVIGAMTTHWQMESSALLKQKCPILAETAAVIG